MALIRLTEDGYERVSQVTVHYDLPGLMKLLNVDRATVMDWVYSGDLQCKIIGNVRRGEISATQEQVDRLLAKHPELSR